MAAAVCPIKMTTVREHGTIAPCLRSPRLLKIKLQLKVANVTHRMSIYIFGLFIPARGSKSCGQLRFQHALLPITTRAKAFVKWGTAADRPR